jgi:hypothetical protein
LPSRDAYARFSKLKALVESTKLEKWVVILLIMLWWGYSCCLEDFCILNIELDNLIL